MAIQYESNPLEMRRLYLTQADGTTSTFIATVPDNAVLSVCRIHIITPYDATGSNLLRLGINPNGSSLGINLDVSQPAETIIDRVAEAIKDSPMTADRDMYATYSFTGDAPTAGDILIELGWY